MMKRVMAHLLPVAGLILLLTACNQESSSPTPPVASAPQSYLVHGVVKELDPNGKNVTIQHEAISNYMGAMTMPFDVHDSNVLRGLKPGDAVMFKLMITSNDGWIHSITRQTPATNGPVAPTTLRVTRAVEPLDVGQTLPDYHFTNELGQAISLSQYKGQVFAFTFFFTSCPYPNYCPRLTGNFAAAGEQLRQATNAPAHWHLFSISFDPKTDSPEHLLAYAEGAHYDPAHWNFLTGDPEQISELSDNVGENFWTENNSISHNLRTVVIGPDFRIRKIFVGNGWTPEELVQEMEKTVR